MLLLLDGWGLYGTRSAIALLWRSLSWMATNCRGHRSVVREVSGSVEKGWATSRAALWACACVGREGVGRRIAFRECMRGARSERLWSSINSKAASPSCTV